MLTFEMKSLVRDFISDDLTESTRAVLADRPRINKAAFEEALLKNWIAVLRELAHDLENEMDRD